METDDFFYRLLKQLPDGFFQLIGMPAGRARLYRFDAVELKKSLRIDGLFLPKRPDLPLLFVEVQFQPLATFYANLFTKVFGYLEENDPTQDWLAVPIFVSEAVEPKAVVPYEPLLKSDKVKRVYLKDRTYPDDPSPGLGLMQLVTASKQQTPEIVSKIVSKAAQDAASRQKVIQLLEELLVRRFPEMTREEVRNMYELADLRKTRVWKEIHDEGIAEGEARQKIRMIHRCLAKGMSTKEISELLDIPVQEVKRLSKKQ